MAIQNRRGREVDFDPSKMLPGEWAVSLDTKYVRMCFAPGVCLRMATYEAFEADMEQIQAILAETKSIQSAIIRIQSEVNEKAALTIENAKSAEESAEIAHDEAERAKMYAENASAVTGIEIAKQDRAGIIKGGENHIAEDGTLQLTKQTTDTTLSNSYAGGIKINSIAGVSEQDGTPTPENPIEIKSVEVGEIKSVGKNLFDYKEVLETWYKPSSSNAYRKVFTLKPNTQYTLSCDVLNDNAAFCFIISGEDLDFTPSSSANGVRPSRTVLTDANGKLTIGTYLVSSADSSITLEVAKIQLEEGDTVTEYQPYQESTITLSNPITLHGIEDSKDRFVRKDGVWSVERNTYEFMLDGSESGWTQSSSSVNGFYNSLVIAGIAKKSTNVMLSDSYMFSEIALGSMPDKTIKHGVTTTALPSAIIAIKDSSYSTIAELKAGLAANPVHCIVKRAEPIYEELPTADQIALNSLLSFDEVTYISTDSEIEAVIDLEYGTSKVGALALENANLHEVVNKRVDDINSNLAYKDIGDKFTTDTSKIKIGAYVENGVVTIHARPQAGVTGVVTAQLNEISYAPRVIANGIYSAIQSTADKSKFVSGNINANGTLSLWFDPALTYEESVVFTYPLKR